MPILTLTGCSVEKWKHNFCKTEYLCNENELNWLGKILILLAIIYMAKLIQSVWDSYN